MDSAHALAVVCRAKQICRENGLTAPDEVLGYLCQCADLNGSWTRLMGAQHRAGAVAAAEPVVMEKSPASHSPQQDTSQDDTDMEHVNLVKAIEKLARSIAHDFAAGSIPVRLATVQLEMERSFQAHQQAAEDEQRAHAERLSAKARVLLDFRRKHVTVQEMNSIYNQVVFYACMGARLDSALHDPAHEQDVRAAVESVFPFSSLAQFLTATRNEKELQLEELPHIIAGICLFNQSKGASTAGACAVALQQHAIVPEDTLHACVHQLQFVRRTLHCYSGALARDGLEALHGESLAWLQAQAFLMQLHSAVTASCTAAEKLASEMAATVSEVERLVQDMNAVPKQTVLPLFHRIGQLFEVILEERRLVTVHQALLDKVQQMIATFPTSFGPAHGQACNAVEVAALAESGHTELLDAAGDAVNDCVTEPAHMPADVDACEHPAWGGVDIVVFVRHDGLLLPAAPDAMCVQHPSETGPWFGFSSNAAAEEFGRRPLAYIRAAHKTLLGKPHLTPTVGQLDDSLPPLLTRVLAMGFHILRLDCATQTPTHFVEQHVDSRYHWNQWALRRQALALANLQSKLTKTAQTGVSSFRRDNESQYWQPKIATSQTPHNKGQSMPKKLRYMSGLRGDPISVQFNVVSLELDLGQPHQL